MASTPGVSSRPSTMEQRWTDSSPSSEGEDSLRSYCEVLRSGSPPVASLAPTEVRLSRLVWRLRRRAGPRTASGKRRIAPLPATVVREELPQELAGRCFNCLAEYHMAALCPNSTVCLHCRGEGQVARLCLVRHSSSSSPLARQVRGPPPPVEGQAGLITGGRRPSVTLLAWLGPAATAAKTPRTAVARGAPAVAQVVPSRPVQERVAALQARRRSIAVAPVQPVAPAQPAVGGMRPTRQVAAAARPAEIPAPGLLVSPPALLPWGAASARPRVETCIIPRSRAIMDEEETLQWSLVVTGVGNRPCVPLSSVISVISDQFPALPDDFLVVFCSRAGRDDVLATETLGGRGFTLSFAPWNRFRQAVGRSQLFQVHLELEGIPPHAWSVATPIVEPPAPVEEDDDLMVPPEQMVSLVVDLLEYRVLVHLLQVEEGGESTDCSSSDDDSDDPGFYSGAERVARGPRRNSFSCSRGRVDYDNFGDRYGRHVNAGGRVLAGANTVVSGALFSAEEPAGPAGMALSEIGVDPLPLLPRDWSASSEEGWDPMLLEASLSPRALVAGSLLSEDTLPEPGVPVLEKLPEIPGTLRGPALSTFEVCLSSMEVVALPSPEVDSQAVGEMEERDVELFRASVQCPVDSILARLAARRSRRRVSTPPSPRRSRRLAIKGVPSFGVKRQQKVLIQHLGLAREGEHIGDEALQAYLRLFEQPLSTEHLSAILALFGWEFQALLLEEGAVVATAS
ncbi:hypothetical protein BRADI_3g20864v3 [Brachypodium distachyon]|uniref:Uncharacterized protein n=1 Tax=Brachypodium distachyon TaxID=15368 RepID=A0A2K2CYK4_BRADI|nr:hypothetical protein BRADI_3g20864v3 [Brachypodium distachyon]